MGCYWVGANERNMKHQQRHGDRKQLLCGSCNITRLFYLSIGICFLLNLKRAAYFCALKKVLYSYNILLITLQKTLDLGDVMTQVKTQVSNFTFI